ncbi:MAG: helix-turn-helix domain-containing protein [Thermoplasmatales archaeon]|nr:helix-turn-helix domain-containing protein [Thermoplasmatales archaeon]
MARGEVNPINRIVPLTEIEKRIQDLEKSARILKRLYFVKFRYQGERVEGAAKMVGVTKKLGYIWQDRWDREGFNGLIPRFGGGRHPLLDDEKKKSLVSILEKRDDWSTRGIRALIKEKFGIEYSMKHIREILRELGMKFGKPYPHDYRRPKDAEERLKKTDSE